MSILKKPILTEKLSVLGKSGVYGFIVDRRASKGIIRRELERFYGVEVDRVNTVCCSGKLKGRYTRSGLIKGRKPAYKKAFVKVKEGYSIDLYTNI